MESKRFEVTLTWEVESGVSLPITVTGDRWPRDGEDCGEIWIDTIKSGGSLPKKVSMALRESDAFWDAVEVALDGQ